MAVVVDEIGATDIAILPQMGLHGDAPIGRMVQHPPHA